MIQKNCLRINITGINRKMLLTTLAKISKYFFSTTEANNSISISTGRAFVFLHICPIMTQFNLVLQAYGILLSTEFDTVPCFCSSWILLRQKATEDTVERGDCTRSLMDRASASGAGDCGFNSHRVRS